MGGVRFAPPDLSKPMWTVPRLWPDEAVFLLGGGPSLASFDLDRLRGRRVIALNRLWERAPWADVLYFCDQGYWCKYRDKIAAGWQGGHVVTISKAQASQPGEPRIRNLRKTGNEGLDTNTGCLRGNNSGHQGINLAYHLGAKRIVLLGYDMKVDGTKTHSHDGYGPRVTPAIVQRRLDRMLSRIGTLVAPLAAAGVEVVNATPDSAITCWPYRSVEEVL